MDLLKDDLISIGIIKDQMISNPRSRNQLIHSIASFALEPIDYLIIEFRIHYLLSRHDPKVAVVRTTDNHVSVVFLIAQFNHPILSSYVQCLHEFYFQLGVGAVFGNGFTHIVNVLSVFIAMIVHFNFSIVFKRIDCVSIRASSLPEVRNERLLPPSATISSYVHERHCIRSLLYLLLILVDNQHTRYYQYHCKDSC